MSTIIVAAAVIRNKGRYLLCQRPSHKRHGGLWEFPGGKLHDGESVTDAIRRELREELHVEPVRVGPVRATIPDHGSAFVISFVDVEIRGEPRSTEHDAVEWVATPDLLRYPLAPSDQAFARTLTGKP
jgi:mutator protein MutT